MGIHAAGAARGARGRWLPRSALATSVVLLCMAVASAFSGAVLYAFYEYRLSQTEDRVDRFEATFEERLTEAAERIGQQRDAAVAEIQAQLDELERFSASGETLAALLARAQPSVWFVATLDEIGQPSAGSAFVVFADERQSFLLSSHAVVRAATAEPGPTIALRKGDEELPAELVAWDAASDLALLVVDRGGLPALEWAPPQPPIRVGDRLFAIGGLGGSGGAIAQGFVAGVSAEGVQHDTPVGPTFQGGPLLNSGGQVVAVASRAYAPLGFRTEAVFFGVPVRKACDHVLRCPNGAPGGQG